MEEVKSFNDWVNNKTSKVEEVALSGDDADKYAKDKQLDIKKQSSKPSSELASGGPIESEMIDLIADLEAATGFELKITSGNDEFHHGIQTYKSIHTTGKAIDVTSDSFSSLGNRKKMEEAILDLMMSKKHMPAGFRLGCINEYDKATSKSTGGHFHLSQVKDKSDKDHSECTLPLIGIKSYSKIRNILKSGSKPDFSKDTKSPTSIISKISSIIAPKRRYYKVYDKAGRTFMIAKYIKETDSFKLYNKTKDIIGEIVKDGDRIIKITGGVRTDITSEEYGDDFKRLFTMAAQGEGGSTSSNVRKTDITLDTGSNVNISNKSNIKLSPGDFIKTYGPTIIEATKDTPLFPSVKLAQAALETGWGEHVIGDANNMFGIKATGSTNKYWDGSKVAATTDEVYNGERGQYQKEFRKYDSLRDSILDHSNLLLTSDRYAQVRDAKTPEEQAEALQRAGYATAPNYANQLISIINSNGFKSLDQQAGKNIA